MKSFIQTNMHTHHRVYDASCTRVALSAKHTRFTLTHGGIYRMAHTLTRPAVTFDGRWRRRCCLASTHPFGFCFFFCRQFLMVKVRHGRRGEESNGAHGFHLDRVRERVCVADSGGDDATAVQLEGPESRCCERRTRSPLKLLSLTVSTDTFALG